MAPESTSHVPERIKRSKAWVVYAILTVLSAIGTIASPDKWLAGLTVTVLLGLYTRYLYRGGKIVIIFFPSIFG